MANAFAMIDESLWRRDRDFRALPRFAQCTFLQVLSQRDVDCAGILTLHVDLLAKGCDEITTEHIAHDLKTLEQARFVYVDNDTDELLIRSYARRVSARSPNALKAALKAAKTVVSPKLRHILATELRRLDRADATTTADQIDPGETYAHNPSERDTPPPPNPIPNPSERGNPSGRDPEPPSCRSVVDVAAPTVGGYFGGARARDDQPEPAEPPAPADEPPRYCPKHMPDGTPDNCGACKGYGRLHTRWLQNADIATKERAQAAAREQATRRATERQQAEDARQTAITNCPLCDPDGYNGTTVCDHTDRRATAARGIAAVKAALTGQPPDHAEEPENDTQPPQTDTTDPNEPPY